VGKLAVSVEGPAAAKGQVGKGSVDLPMTGPQDVAIAMSAMWLAGMFTTGIVIAWRKVAR
jgi:hypothetical protein